MSPAAQRDEFMRISRSLISIRSEVTDTEYAHRACLPTRLPLRDPMRCVKGTSCSIRKVKVITPLGLVPFARAALGEPSLEVKCLT